MANEVRKRRRSSQHIWKNAYARDLYFGGELMREAAKDQDWIIETPMKKGST